MQTCGAPKMTVLINNVEIITEIMKMTGNYGHTLSCWT